MLLCIAWQAHDNAHVCNHLQTFIPLYTPVTIQLITKQTEKEKIIKKEKKKKREGEKKKRKERQTDRQIESRRRRRRKETKKLIICSNCGCATCRRVY